MKRYYFTTRDLLMMAALAALGGIASTYLSAVGAFFRSILGFAGTTQWAAGIHVLWLTLAVGLTGKLGTGTFTGLLKGAVELLTGNPHGVLVLLINLVAGVIIDAVFLPFREKDRLPAYLVAGGLAAASNVFVFQLFAALPADVLTYGAMLLVGGVAGLSGALFAGVLAHALLNALRRAGAIKDRAPAPLPRYVAPVFLTLTAGLTLGLGVYLHGALRGPAVIHIGGAVDAPYAYPVAHGDIAPAAAQGTLHGVTREFTGIPLAEVVARAAPAPHAELVLITAADGYAFFVSMAEVRANPALLLAPQGEGDAATYNLVGAENSKAWVRGVSRIEVVGAAPLEITGALAEPAPFDADAWQFEMDRATLVLEGESRAVQGAPLGAILAAQQPAAAAARVILHTPGDPVTLPLADVLADSDIRLFTVIGEAGVTYAVARMQGAVIAPRVTRIEVQ